jgi:hypothetical protein
LQRPEVEVEGDNRLPVFGLENSQHLFDIEREFQLPVISKQFTDASHVINEFLFERQESEFWYEQRALGDHVVEVSEVVIRFE